MSPKGSKYIKLLSRDLKSNKSGLRNSFKYNLLKLVCKNHTLANFQLDGIIAEHLNRKNSLRMLDIGAGLCNYYPENVKESSNKYIAYDLSKDMKNNLDKRGIIIFQADINKDKLKLEDESIDLIICSHLIEHLHNPTNLLLEIERLLTKSGILFIKTPDIKSVKWNFYNDFTHTKPYSKSSLSQQVESEKLKIKKCYSTTLYLDFAKKLFLKNILNPFNFIFLVIGIYTFYFRKDMREIICLSKKL